MNFSALSKYFLSVLFRRASDGLKDLRYKLISTVNEKLFTNITVDIKMPKKLIELEREAAKKEALKLAKEAAKKAIAKKKSKNKESSSDSKDELEEDIKVPKVEVKDTNIVRNAANQTSTASTTSNITSEIFQHVEKSAINSTMTHDVSN